MTTLFDHNLTLLAERAQALVDRMKTLQPDRTIQTAPSASGTLTAFRTTPDGKTHFLHSRIDPIEEGTEWSDRIDCQASVVFVLGMGLGYHVRSIAELLHNHTAIHVIEGSEHLFHAALEIVDFAPLFARGEINFWIGRPVEEIATDLSALSVPFSYHLYLPALSLNPGYYDAIVKILEKKQYDNRRAGGDHKPFFGKGIDRLLGEMTR